MANPDQDEERAKQREAVAAMSNAKANMSRTLDRVDTLERELSNARSGISRLKDYISPSVYTFGDAKKSCHSIADEMIASIEKVLG